MATAIAIVGSSSSGKSTSLRNLDHTQTYIVSPSKAEAPFAGFNTKYVQKEGTGNFFKTNDIKVVDAIIKGISEKRHDIKVLVIEDMTHFFNAITLGKEFRDKGKMKDASWSRWADFGARIYETFFANLSALRDDLIIVLQFHSEVVSDGFVEIQKMKTPGNLLEREVDIPSYFTYVFYTKVLPFDKNIKSSDRYKFVTNSDGVRPAKSPYGLFNEDTELEIPNDLDMVIKRIIEFKN